MIAGEVAGCTGSGATTAPMAMLHVTLAPGASLHLPWRADSNALAYVLSRDGTAGTERRPVSSGRLAVFGEGGALTISAADAQDARHGALDVVVLGGLPIGEPVAWAGPFVMNTEDEVRQAYRDFQAGRLGAVPAEHLPHAGTGNLRGR